MEEHQQLQYQLQRLKAEAKFLKSWGGIENVELISKTEKQGE